MWTRARRMRPLTWSLPPHPPAARFEYDGSRRLKPESVSTAGRTYSKETAMLIRACGLAANNLLPPAPTYVDSFGPFYLEFGLRPQPATTDRTQRRRARDILETMAGLSPATGGVKNAVPRLLWLHRLNPVTRKSSYTLALSLRRGRKLFAQKAESPDRLSFRIPVGAFITRRWKSLNQSVFHLIRYPL